MNSNLSISLSFFCGCEFACFILGKFSCLLILSFELFMEGIDLSLVLLKCREDEVVVECERAKSGRMEHPNEEANFENVVEWNK